MTPLDLIVRATIHDGPGRAVHAQLGAALATIATPSDEDVAAALVRFEQEANQWSLWRTFSMNRLRCLQRGLADARLYDVRFEFTPAPAGLASWAALREMAEVRASFRPWDRENLLGHLRALAPRFREIGAARVLLFGSAARSAWDDGATRRSQSDLDLMVYPHEGSKDDALGIAEACGRECGRLFGYSWDAQAANWIKEDFHEKISDDALEVLS